MVGGTVIGVSILNGVALLNVRDSTYGDECAVRCIPEVNGRSITILLGDDVWWQCGKVYWTPAGNKNTPACRFLECDDVLPRRTDVPLEKVGYSH